MSHDLFSLLQQNIRGTDSNSLLRLYDRAKDLSTKSPSRQERVRADKALQRLAKELQKRNIPFAKGPEGPPQRGSGE